MGRRTAASGRESLDVLEQGSQVLERHGWDTAEIRDVREDRGVKRPRHIFIRSGKGKRGPGNADRGVVLVGLFTN